MAVLIRRKAAACALGLSALIFVATLGRVGAQPTPLETDPPGQWVRLVFIHHSSGENWLADDNGGLGRALAENNYFVSDTNYGWGPASIGDRTDIPDWEEWFVGPETGPIMQALFAESGQNSPYTREIEDPGGENVVVLFKSCFPNSNLEGSPADPPAHQGGYSVGGAKYVYNRILEYFATRPDRLFVVITAPPVSDAIYGENARALNNWLVEDWLTENKYTYSNVAVFDFYNVLTGHTHHHRVVDGEIEHTYVDGRNTTAYPSEDDHPSREGNRKATQEFVPLLNLYYHRWQEGRAEEAGTGPVKEPSEPLTDEAAPTNEQAPLGRAPILGVTGLCIIAAVGAGTFALLIAALLIYLRRRRH